MSQCVGDALNDRQAKAQSGAVSTRRACAAVELIEDALLFALRDAESGIDHVEITGRPAAANADKHAAAGRVVNGIGNEIENDPPKKNRIAFDNQAAAADFEPDLARSYNTLECGMKAGQQIVETKRPHFRDDNSCVQLRNVEE